MRLLILFLTLFLLSSLAEASDSLLGECASLSTKVEKHQCVREKIESAPIEFDDSDGFWVLGPDDQWIVYRNNPESVDYSNIGVYYYAQDTSLRAQFVCNEGMFQVGFVLRGSELESEDGMTTFLTWVDGSGPIENSWRTLDKNAVGTEDARRHADFVKNVIGASEVKMRFSAKSGVLTSLFDARILKYAILPLLVECPL